MVNASSAHGQSGPTEGPRQLATCPPDCDLPENSRENLDARLDLGVEETFPASDPVSVTVTKKSGPEGQQEFDASASGRQREWVSDQAEQDTAEELLDQVREAVQNAAQTAYGSVHRSYEETRRYALQASDRYPEVEHSYRTGRRAVEHRVMENPWSSLLMAGAIGYGLAWMIHGRRHGRERGVPDSARTQTRYAPRRGY